ncbi:MULTISPECIES: RluA family pseudouridine synthase [Kocuria]|uniref:Pseudouridine synthase n=1 Tax=Kocuria subflava TaxID=1736139 RepID=A0A846TKA6_9MICC|nr:MULTISPECIES: RluA family pseudouridine synthase [Kocuria]NKE08893.1 RluA family pseudouridine synthase [Kocuria subflava]
MTERVTEHFTVPPELDGQRADAAVARLSGQSRTVVGKLLRAGEVQADGTTLNKSAKLTAGTSVTVLMPEQVDLADVTPEVVAGFDVVYCDDDIVVVDKPAGVAAHPSPGWKGPTVVSALAGAGVSVSTSGAAERQGIVHRLDVGTSGLMVVARTERAYTALKRAFKQRTVEKVYHTVVQGLPDPLEGTIDAPIGRHPGHEWRFAVVDDGRDSVTHYQTLEAFGRATLVEVHLETGRTHQIRVHFSALHHPCCGDLTYGADPALSAGLGLTRQWLHARRLGFEHPATGQNVTFESPYPQDLDYALETLRDSGP